MEHKTAKIEHHKPICSCGEKGKLNFWYDAYYCPTGNVWLEKKCDEDECVHCSNRPEKPL
jgi:hypothetical protein